MTALWSPAAGENPTAAQFATYKPLYARRSTDNPQTSNTSLTADGVLFIPNLSISVEYEVHMHLLIKANNATNGGMKFDFTVPTGADISNFIFHAASPSNFAPTNASGSVTGLTLGTGNNIVTLRGTVVMSTTSGTLQFRWAQNSLSANQSIVSAGSFLRLTQVT